METVKQGGVVQWQGRLQPSWQEVTAGGHPTRERGRPGEARGGVRAAWETAGAAGHGEPCWARPSIGSCPRAATVLSHLDQTEPLSPLKPRFEEQKAPPRLMPAASRKRGSCAWRLYQIGVCSERDQLR